MKKYFCLNFHLYLTSLSLFALFFFNSTSTFALDRVAEDLKTESVPDELIVKFKETEEPTESFKRQHQLKSADKILARFKFRETLLDKLKKSGVERLYKLKIEDSSKKDEILKSLNADPKVEYAEPNFIYRTTATPNDQDFSKLWGLFNTGQTGGTAGADIDASLAWNITKSSNIVVGVIDTGVDYTHEDLAANMWKNPGEIAGNGIDDNGNGFVDDVYGWDFVNDDSNPMDDHGHGTHVAGTIGGVGNNGVGVAGVNWTAKIAALKFLNRNGSGTTADAIQAVQYANLMGIKITNNSWGGGGYSQALADAIATGASLFIAAAGNSGQNTDSSIFYPAGYNFDNIISVAATDHNDDLASFSNYGTTSVDLGAPGVNIYSTVPKGFCSLCTASGYKSISGTSMATPHVAGVAALVWSNNSGASNLQIKNQILGSVDRIASLQGKTLSNGRLNVNNILDLDSTPTVVVFSDSFEVSEWNALWTEDSQNDWFRSRQRKVGTGRYSAEVDGKATDAQLISKAIDLQGKTQAQIKFSWLIESSFDTGEYIAFDVSTDNGATWIEKAKLRGNVDPENSWRQVTVDLTNINQLKLRFRGNVSDSSEDGNVDMVSVVAN